MSTDTDISTLKAQMSAIQAKVDACLASAMENNTALLDALKTNIKEVGTEMLKPKGAYYVTSSHHCASV